MIAATTSNIVAMRVVRMLTLLFDAFGGAWVLLLSFGIYVDATEHSVNGFYLTSPPSHPRVHLAAYLIVVIGLQFLSAWLLVPGTPRKRATAYWGRFAGIVVVCFCGCMAAALILLFVLLQFCSDC